MICTLITLWLFNLKSTVVVYNYENSMCLKQIMDLTFIFSFLVFCLCNKELINMTYLRHEWIQSTGIALLTGVTRLLLTASCSGVLMLQLWYVVWYFQAGSLLQWPEWTSCKLITFTSAFSAMVYWKNLLTGHERN